MTSIFFTEGDSFGRITQETADGLLQTSFNYSDDDGNLTWLGPLSVTEANGSTTRSN